MGICVVVEIYKFTTSFFFRGFLIKDLEKYIFLEIQFICMEYTYVTSVIVEIKIIIGKQTQPCHDVLYIKCKAIAADIFIK